MSEKKEQTFESAVKDLEKIVSELESGELDLDKSAVEEMFKQYDFSLETTDADVKAFQNVADFMLKTGMIENEVNAEDLFIK